jgi:hypothetical protein
MQFVSEQALEAAVMIARAPIQHTEILPSLLPIILGAIVIELYFGKYSKERLGWNSSVSNSIIWLATGLNLYFTETFSTTLEKNATFLLIGMGGFVGAMDFFHVWPKNLAFLASAPTVVYLLAYVTVVAVKTPIPVNEVTIQGAIIFSVCAFVGFEALKFIEPSSDKFQLN